MNDVQHEEVCEISIPPDWGESAVLGGLHLLRLLRLQSVDGPELYYRCVSWCNTIAPWPYDGNPYETDNYVIYSDGVSLEALRILGEYAENALVLVKSELGADNDTLLACPPGQDKLHIYAYKYRFPQDWGGQGFYGG